MGDDAVVWCAAVCGTVPDQAFTWNFSIFRRKYIVLRIVPETATAGQIVKLVCSDSRAFISLLHANQCHCMVMCMFMAMSFRESSRHRTTRIDLNEFGKFKCHSAKHRPHSAIAMRIIIFVFEHFAMSMKYSVVKF